MPKPSAGILMYRYAGDELEVLIVHPGGPTWKNRDVGAWSIPKGEFDTGEDVLKTALREFHEELGTRLSGEFVQLKPVRQKSGKIVHAYATEGDLDTETIESNTFMTEWPPKSGRIQEFPEVDRAIWCDIETAREKLIPAQAAFLDELVERFGKRPK
jgi:predicted NUDIX family NTP pyrophosphohydrolase